MYWACREALEGFVSMDVDTLRHGLRGMQEAVEQDSSIGRPHCALPFAIRVLQELVTMYSDRVVSKSEPHCQLRRDHHYNETDEHRLPGRAQATRVEVRAATHDTPSEKASVEKAGTTGAGGRGAAATGAVAGTLIASLTAAEQMSVDKSTHMANTPKI